MSDTEITAIEFQFVKNQGDKTLQASTGTVDGYNWTGQAGEVVFNVDEGTGHLQISGLKVGLSEEDSGIGHLYAGTNATDGVVYTLSGVRVSKDYLSKGIYIRDGKKFIVR